jgi:hypothetical protein
MEKFHGIPWIFMEFSMEFHELTERFSPGSVTGVIMVMTVMADCPPTDILNRTFSTALKLFIFQRYYSVLPLFVRDYHFDCNIHNYAHIYVMISVR